MFSHHKWPVCLNEPLEFVNITVSSTISDSETDNDVFFWRTLLFGMTQHELQLISEQYLLKLGPKYMLIIK